MFGCRVAHVQIDLLMRCPSGFLHLVEVKSSRAFDYGVLSRVQEKRLKQALMVLCEAEPARLMVLVESGNGFEEIMIED